MIYDHFHDFITKNFKPFSDLNIVIGLSGGADSTALAFLLKKLITEKEFSRFSVSTAHLNHSLRKTAAEDDQNFCRSLSEELSFDFFTETVDVTQFMQKHKLSVEHAARICRYNFLYKVCQANKSYFLLTMLMIKMKLF
jgi:tRNA(Ile)-lysidine synthase